MARDPGEVYTASLDFPAMRAPPVNRGFWTTPRRCLLILVAVLGLHLCLNQIWLERDRLSGGCDVFAHLENQLKVHDQVVRLVGDPSWTRIERLFFSEAITPYKWPKVTYLVTSIGTALFSRDPVTTQLFAGSVFYALMVLSCFYLGLGLYGPRTALVGSLILALYPYPLSLSRTYGLDLPLAAMTTLSLAVLVAGRSFSSRRHAVALAVLVLLTLLTKPQGAIFLAFPLAWVMAGTWRDARRSGPPSKDPRVRNLLLFLGLGLVLALPLIVPMLRSFWVLATEHAGSVGRSLSTVPKASPIAHFLYYLINIFSLLSPLFVILLLFALYLRKPSGFLLGAVLVPLLIFTLVFENRWTRFLAPLAPLLALCSAEGLCTLRRPALRQGLTAGVLLLGGLQVLVLGFGPNPYQRLIRRLNDWGVPINPLGLRAPQRFDMRAQLRPLTLRLGQNRGRLDLVRIGIVEDMGLGRDYAPLIQYLTRVEHPGRPLEFVRVAQMPVPFFKPRSPMDELVVAIPARRAGSRPDLDALFARYEQERSKGERWPAPYFNYRGTLATEATRELARWPVRFSVLLRPDGVRLFLLSPPARGRI